MKIYQYSYLISAIASFLMIKQIVAYTTLYVSDMQTPQMIYFNDWQQSNLEDVSNTFGGYYVYNYHRYAKNQVSTLSKVYTTNDPHSSLTIAVDIVLIDLTKSQFPDDCWNQKQSHLNNPMCILTYKWVQGEDYIILLIDGQPTKIDNFSSAQKSDYYENLLHFETTISHNRETLSIEIIPYNTKWNLLTSLRKNLQILMRILLYCFKQLNFFGLHQQIYQVTITQVQFLYKLIQALFIVSYIFKIKFKRLNSIPNKIVYTLNIFKYQIKSLKVYYEVCNDNTSCICLSCSNDNKCQKCEYKKFYNSATAKCEDCPTNCFYCSDASTCFSCVKGYYLNKSNGKCEDPTLHTNSVGIEGVWVASPNPNCEIWDKNSVCVVEKKTMVCPDGFFGKLCDKKCDSILGCKSCSQYLSCDECDPTKPLYYNQICSQECQVEGYYRKSQTECDRCHPSCLTCDGPQDNNCLSCDLRNKFFEESQHMCKQCEIIYFPNDILNVCEKCSDKILNCLECYNSGGQPYCTKCSQNSYLYRGNCYADCSTLPNTKQFEAPINECVDCYEGCFSCDDFIMGIECKKCALNFYRYQDTCILSCLEVPGTYANESTKDCQKCQDFNCLVCDGQGMNQCTECAEYTQIQNRECKYCSERQFYNKWQRICMNCPQHCEICSDANICSLCDDGYYLDKQQVGSPCVAVCSGIQYGDRTKRQCFNCPKGTVKNNTTQQCDSCEEGCEVCESIGSYSKCTKCFPSYILNMCNSQGKQCTKCPHENQYSIGSNSQCFFCDPKCKTCTGQGQQNCVDCADGYFKGDYLCYDCDKSCKTCALGPNLCTECQVGYDYISYQSSLPKSKYKICYQTCPVNQNTDKDKKICYSCYFSCQTCFGPLQNQCETCIDKIGGFHLFKTKDNQCLVQCPLLTYADIATKTCKDCDKSCNQCSGPLESDCTVCADGYIYREASKQCLSVCPNGEYHEVSSNTCQKCMTICETCSTADTCQTCFSPLYLSSDKKSCINLCPPSEYQNNKQRICIKCPSNCIECTSSKTCTTCKNGYLVEGGFCVQTCSDGYYPSSPNATQCLPCSTDCAKCTEKECLQCEIKSYVILGKECLKQCPDEYLVRNGKCVKTEEDIQRYMDCYVDCKQEKQFSDDSDDTVKSIELSQASMNGLSMFFGGLGNYFFYWLQMQQILGNMVFLQNTRALGIGSLHLKTLYMENLFNLIPVFAPEGDVIKAFEQRSDAIAQGLQPQNLYAYFVQNCQYSLSALTLGFLLIPILYKLSKDSELCHLLYLYCKWNLVIRLIMISSNFLLLCTFFKFKAGSMSGGLSAADFICIAVFLLVYITMLSFLIYCNRSSSLDHQTQMSINAFYYDIETTSILQKSFWIFFEIRKFIVCFLVVITEGSVIVPWTYLTLCIAFLIYCHRINPFKQIILHRYVLISEIINIICVFFLGLTVTLHAQSSSVYYAYIFVIMLIIYQLWALVTQLYQLAKLLITLFLKYKVPRSPNQRNRTVSSQPFLLKSSINKTSTEQIIKQINAIDLTDVKLETSQPSSPRKKRETQGLFRVK